MTYREPAEVDQASAAFGRGTLTITASGTVPQSCWQVSIDPSPLDIWPPQFVVVRRRTRMVCLEMITPYVVETSLTIPEPIEEVTLHHAGGELVVPVKSHQEVPRPAVAPDEDYDEAVGRSRGRFSFDEAFHDAVNNLPVNEPGGPDWMEHIEVVRTHAEIGGIAGAHDLVVHVRRGRPAR